MPANKFLLSLATKPQKHFEYFDKFQYFTKCCYTTTEQNQLKRQRSPSEEDQSFVGFKFSS